MTYRHRVGERRQLPISVPLPVIPSPPITHLAPPVGKGTDESGNDQRWLALAGQLLRLLQGLVDGLGLGTGLDFDTVSMARLVGGQETNESAAAAGQVLHLEAIGAQLLESLPG